ncbi:AAEL008202-PA [Aedes aegypti]|uniref:AAEL008202-PA n=1 Tax=Aedes aegypti TaxID=7159 RepID=Q16ZE8_AEDAE|nr:AAEL008202-PA [Aedes aegypti]
MIKSFVLFAFLATLTLCRVHGVPMTALQGDTGWMEMSRFWIRLPNLDYRKEVVVSEASIGGSKIAGGTIAEKQQFPYQAAILINFLDGSGVLCGGAIISSTYVLTAAHCSDGAIDATVIVGTNVISIPSDDQAVEIKVTFHDILVHPLYDPVEVVNDIAIVRLTRALAFSNKIQPIRLPNKKEALLDLANTDATVSGWGALSGEEYVEITGSVKLELRYTNNPVISNDVCGKVFQDMIRHFHVCVSGDKGRNACQGDSGGPLRANLNGKTTLIGIVSYGSVDGCEKGSPAVYTRVGSYLEWITQHTNVPIEN